MGLFRIIKVWKNVKTRYNGTIECSKNLDDVINFAKNHPKAGLYHGNFRIVKDKRWHSLHELEKQNQTIQAISGQIMNINEEYKFKISFYGNVAYRLEVDINGPDAQVSFKELEEEFNKLPSVKADIPAQPTVNKIDLSSKTLAEALKAFENSVKDFGSNPNSITFSTVKEIRDQIGKKIDQLDSNKKAQYMTHLSQVDTFINALSMQLSNPAMASSVGSFAASYVSQMQTAICQMMAL